MPLRRGECEQLPLFRALPGDDMALRDAQDLMAYPFFSLGKSRRTVPIRFEAGSRTWHRHHMGCRRADLGGEPDHPGSPRRHRAFAPHGGVAP